MSRGRQARAVDYPGAVGESSEAAQTLKGNFMKKMVFRMGLAVMFGAVGTLPLAAQSEVSTNAPSPSLVAELPPPVVMATPVPVAPPPAPAADTSVMRLPYGVEDVLKLTHAQVGEDITLNYVRNSGTVYNLSATDIVYLRNQGVSDRVVNAMMDQRKTVPGEQTAETVANTAAVSTPAAFGAPETAMAPAPIYMTPGVAPVYVPVPVPEVQYQEPASTLYVIPYGPARAAYYGHYRPYGSGYYGSSYSYYGPAYSCGYHGGYGGVQVHRFH
jgi:hypothetical protein